MYQILIIPMKLCEFKTKRGLCKNKIKNNQYGCHLHRSYTNTRETLVTPIYDLLPQEMWEIIFTYTNLDSLSSLGTTCVELRKSIDLYLFKTPLYIIVMGSDKCPQMLKTLHCEAVVSWTYTGSHRFGYKFYDIDAKKIFKKNYNEVIVEELEESSIVNITTDATAKNFVHIFSSVLHIDKLRKLKRILNWEMLVLSGDYTQRNVEIMDYINNVPVYKPHRTA